MMVLEQLAQSQFAAHLPMPTPTEFVRLNLGLLGNESIQVPGRITDPDSLLTAYRKLLASTQPAFKLALLKGQKFTPEGRQQRIAESLAAVNATQATGLTLAQWK